MAWTTPKTWSAGDVLTAADVNTYVRDNTAWLNQRPQVCVYSAASQNVASGATAQFLFDTQHIDTDGMWPGADNYKVKFPHAGNYLIGAHVLWSGHADSSYRLLQLRLNGSTGLDYDQHQPDGAGSPQGISCRVSTLVTLAANDYVELMVGQASGSTIAISGGLLYNALWAYQVG